MLRNNFDFALVVNGGSVKEYEHQGQVFVEGKKGTEFSIRIKNNTHKRSLAVITVDGKSVIDGAPGNLDTGGGYIVDAYSSITVPGWRLDNDAVAKFVFADPGDSYVAQSDDGAEAMDNIGVIGCAMFYEQATVWNLNWYQPHIARVGTACPPLNTTDIWYGTSSGTNNLSHVVTDCMTRDAGSNTVPCNASLDASSGKTVCNLGTGFGAASSHAVSVQSFQRCNEPETVFTLYYDTRMGLEARGVNLKVAAHICPSPFPASQGRGCKPPANWNGDVMQPHRIKVREEEAVIDGDIKVWGNIEVNPQVKEIKHKKATKEIKKLLKRQLDELRDLRQKIETTEIKIEDTEILDEIKRMWEKTA